MDKAIVSHEHETRVAFSDNSQLRPQDGNNVKEECKQLNSIKLNERDYSTLVHLMSWFLFCFLELTRQALLALLALMECYCIHIYSNLLSVYCMVQFSFI